MSITSKEVQTAVYKLLKESQLCSSVSGRLYHNTTRPGQSHAEDIVVRYTAGLNGDIQSGIVTVLIYTEPMLASDGTPREDIQRTLEIERLATDWVESLPVGRYLFDASETVMTLYDHDAMQFFTSVKLRYNHY